MTASAPMNLCWKGHFEGVDGVHALDISKRLMDYGIHPPTNYFPLIVPEALMIEPTETEDKATLDEFIDAMKKIASEAHEDPDLLTSAPHKTPVSRLDEVTSREATRPMLPSDSGMGRVGHSFRLTKLPRYQPPVDK